MKQRIRLAGYAMCCALLGGCAAVDTIVAPFTEAGADFDKLDTDAAQDAAAQIEAAVYAGNREPELRSPEGLAIDTPEVRQALRSRAARVELVHDLLDRGHAWERRNGRIWILRTKDYGKNATRETKDRDAMIVISENDDRYAIYESIRKENKLDSGAAAAMHQVFFQTRRTYMRAGQRFESEGGEEVVVQ